MSDEWVRARSVWKVARFVVQRHVAGDGEHYDLMFEQEDVLVTWRCPCPLWEVGPEAVVIERIGDHRLAYLEYEGALSAGRGHVKIDERGTYEALERSERFWRMRVSGSRTVGEFVLERGSPRDRGVWMIRRVSGAGSP